MLHIITAVLATSALPIFLLARPALSAPIPVVVALPADLDGLDNHQDVQAVHEPLAALDNTPAAEKAAGANYIFLERTIEKPDMTKSNVFTSPRKRWGWGGGNGRRNCCGCWKGGW